MHRKRKQRLDQAAYTCTAKFAADSTLKLRQCDGKTDLFFTDS